MHLEKCLEARLSRERECEGRRRRRSVLRQKPRREAECYLRREAAKLAGTFHGKGKSRADVAAMLSVSERTLADWEHKAREESLEALPRGRPLHRSKRLERNALLTTIRDLGSHTGVEPLRSIFTEMPRSEIADIVGRYRTVERKRHSLSLHTLQWTTPQAVWAMDHAVPPTPVDGHLEAIFAVRDLATGEPLLWLAVADMTAEETIRALRGLFEQRGVPLVFKHDNGPAFRSDAMREFLGRRDVHQLFSPIKMPSYNGACEASIRYLKRQTEHEAVRQGRAGEWRSEDLERARAVRALLAGAARHEQLPDEVRAAFVATLREKELEVERDLEYARAEGDPMIEMTIKRRALSRALVEHGFLNIRRRRIPLPKNPLFTAKIS